MRLTLSAMDKDTILLGKITRTHLSIAKGWISGLPLPELSKRYLASYGDDTGAVDLRVAKSTLSRVLLELSNAAARNGIKGAATLFRQAKRIRVNSSGPLPEDSPAPSFEEFVLSVPDADAFSDEEMRSLYDERYPPGDDALKRSIARQSRLVERQIKLLRELEPLIAAPMRLEDKLEGWFSPTLVDRLKSAGFKTVQELAVAMLGNPHGWFTSIPGIGRSKAHRLLSYVRHNVGDIEAELHRRGIPFMQVEAVNPQRDRVSVIEVSDLEAVIQTAPVSLVREDLDGSQGRLRDHRNASSIEAANDYEAMKLWLSLKKSSVTVRLYEREIMRLIAWSVHVRRRPMSSLSIEDALAYRDFVMRPPADFIVDKGPRVKSRMSRAEDDGSNVHVGLFTKSALKPSTVKKALVIVSGFFSWLVSVRYVTANPFTGVQVSSGLTGIGMGSTEATDEAGLERARDRRDYVHNRVLPLEAMQAINKYLDKEPEGKDKAFHARARFIFKFASMTGLRISEMAAARRDHLVYIEADPVSGVEGGWLLHVLGKRDKHREVPVPDALIEELLIYLEHRGLVTLPCPSVAVDKGTFFVGGYPTHIQTDEKADVAEFAAKQRLLMDPEARVKRRKKLADGVRPQTIHLALKELFRVSLSSSQFRDEDTAEKMRRASTHWLRHTLATRSVAAGVPVEVVQDLLGHASISTTSIYVHAERHRKMSEMRKLWNTTAPSSTVSDLES